MPPNLPQFPGWRPLRDEEVIALDDVLVCFKNVKIYGNSCLNPNTRPPINITDKSRLGLTYHQAAFVSKNLNDDFYPYRKATYKNMPEGIACPEGWYPLPDDEPMQGGDRFIFRSPYGHYNCDLRAGGMYDGKTTAVFNGKTDAWPFRRMGVVAMQPPGALQPAPRKPRLPPNPERLTRALPLP